MKICNNEIVPYSETNNDSSTNIVSANASNTATNITQNIQTQNNIIQNINTTINIVAYKDNDTIEFLNDHITAQDIAKIFADCTTTDGFRKYTQLLMQRPENRLIKKTNSRSNCSQVFTENNKWESRLDKEVYPKLACEIANNNWDRMRFVIDELKMNKRTLTYILNDLESLASGDTIEDISNYKKIIAILKLFFIDMTKEV
jgi:hypothetical protein